MLLKLISIPHLIMICSSVGKISTILYEELRDFGTLLYLFMFAISSDKDLDVLRFENPS